MDAAGTQDAGVTDGLLENPMEVMPLPLSVPDVICSVTFVLFVAAAPLLMSTDPPVGAVLSKVIVRATVAVFPTLSLTLRLTARGPSAPEASTTLSWPFAGQA